MKRRYKPMPQQVIATDVNGRLVVTVLTHDGDIFVHDDGKWQKLPDIVVVSGDPDGD